MTAQHALGPGEFTVYDQRGRHFTTANDRQYAIRLAMSLRGHVTITLFGTEQTIEID